MDSFDSVPYIETSGLYTFGQNSARLYKITSEGSPRRYLTEKRGSMSIVRKTHALLKTRYGGRADIPAAYEWLLDNMYMAEREYRAAINDVENCGKLRYSASAPVVSTLCRGLILSGHGEVNAARCGEFLTGFESVCVLRRNELCAVPAVLRLEIITLLAEICQSMQYSAETKSFEMEFEVLFSSLRLLSVTDMSVVLQNADITDSILRLDPTGEYSRMDKKTRAYYLEQTEKLARKNGKETHIYARELVEKAKGQNVHIGFLLFPEKRSREGLYIAVFLLFTLFTCLYTGFALGSILAVFLLLLPVSDLCKGIIDLILLKTVKPKRVPRMDCSEGVPHDGRTIIVISALLTGKKDIERYAADLERNYFACRSEGTSLCFGLLADLISADTPECDSDEEIINSAVSEIKRLNLKYGPRFYLFTRPRHYDGEEYSPRERKRGAVTELCKLLCGKDNELRVTGDKDALNGIKFLLTLDSDTIISPGAVGELIGSALHPLNRVVIENNRVIRGHGIFHPRISTELESANATDFSIIYGGSGGCDPYGGVCGELYSDCFDSGGFAGKGLIDSASLLQCVDEEIPAGEVLSHDALEGAYLHGAYVSDAEFADSFPADALSYYKRQHRWIRGDWQNAPWIFSRGKKFKAIDRFRLFDSLRRSLVSPFTLLAIAAGLIFPARGTAAAGIAALICLLKNLIFAAMEDCKRPTGAHRLRRAARLLTGFGGAIVRSFFNLWLLPFDAYISLSAVTTALWRMLITHRKLLQWQTAAQSSSGKRTFSAHIKALLPAMLFGLALMLISPLILGKAAGLMWLLSPAAAFAVALPAYRDARLSAPDKEYIIKAAADSWRYLYDYSTEEDNFLPPDNFQEQPPVGVAHRTSPTNIGFAMVSAVAAVDMGIIEIAVAVDYVNRIMNTIEKMPGCMGHLYNWYDTKTLLPLSPAFISTVDSGNLCASLYTVAVALKEWSEDELSERLEGFADGMNFSPLYDSERQLFYICYDTENKHGAGGWYDLMASEARLTSFTAIAKGDVPKKHWSRLSRAQLGFNNHRGLASWTGTMFEYLMPELFLSLYRGSLLFESSRFCLYAQRRSVFAGKPWGISESAYYSLDGAMSYRYKASGAAALALKRGQEKDCVISPYSSFLALPLAPSAAAANLQRLQNLGARGRLGFYDAVDFTQGRCRSEDGEKVCCYMAHHVGMSIISAANAVSDESIVRRFMSRPEMRAHALLLQEKVPEDSIVIRRENAEVPERAERLHGAKWEQVCTADTETALVLSNGVYGIKLLPNGYIESFYGDITVFKSPCIINGITGTDFYEDHAVFHGEAGNVRFIDCVSVKGSAAGEVHEVELNSRTGGDFTLTLNIKALMCKMKDYAAHPAFWELGIVREMTVDTLKLRRIGRGGMKDLFCEIRCSRNAVFEEDKMIIKLPLLPNETEKITIDISAGFEKTFSHEADSRGNMVSAAASLLGMNGSETGRTMEILYKILVNRLYNACPKRELWQYGISGDREILACDGKSSELMLLIKSLIMLRSCGVNADLVILSDELGEYDSKLKKAVRAMLSHYALEDLTDADGGVHILPMTAENAVYSRAVYFAGRDKALPPALPESRVPIRSKILPKFRHTGNEFHFSMDTLPPKPWSHVLTNGKFSCIVTETGSGYMFEDNAREMQLTPFPESGETITAMRDKSEICLFASDDGIPCHVSCSPGCAVWEKRIFGRNLRLSMFVASADVRLIVIEGCEGLSLRWRLPVTLGDPAGLKSSVEIGVFKASNTNSFIEGLEFYAAVSAVADTKSFADGAEFSFTAGNACVLVCGTEEVAVTELSDVNSALEELRHIRAHWGSVTDVFRCKTGIDELDNYMHPWAIYQTIASRLYARASLYQAGGAYGFRDQLQDAENLLLVYPDMLRDRILDCCRHQYTEGDVMHWWHPHSDGDRGLRSRCSDDLLWLVRALCEYVNATGDDGICFKSVEFITSPPLKENKNDRFETPETAESAFVLDHARAALELCEKRGFGEHGLPFIGSCDWNDGFDDIHGESVWLGWFLCDCAEKFSKLLARLGLKDYQKYAELSDKLRLACEGAFNGAWYNRAYYRDGVALGGLDRIDSLSQSWAAFCGGDEEHVRRALSNAYMRLVDDKNMIVKLFSPPFSPDERRPGYITSYGPGYRENGGQYTHAAIWLAAALFKIGCSDEGWHIMKMLLPETHDMNAYLKEPFVLAADVYSAPGQEGEAGWTWYTGSSGWYFRVITEYMLGIKRVDGALSVSPALPQEIKEYTAEIIINGERYRITGGRDGAETELI